MDDPNYELIGLQKELRRFFLRAVNFNIKQVSHEGISYFNKDLYELESYLTLLKYEYKVNLKLDTRYFSANILNSFTRNPEQFRSYDLSLPFLIHLCQQIEHDSENLVKVIENFISGIVRKLSYPDLVLTKTGTTRCFTNTRFGLSELRKFGLVYNEEVIKGISKRVMLPTPLGYLITLHQITEHRMKPHQFLPAKSDAFSFNRPLNKSLTYLFNSGNEFLNSIINKFSDTKEIERLLKDVLDSYYDHVLPFIKIREDGIQVQEKELKNSMNKYYKMLRDHYELSYKLKRILLDYLEKNKSNQSKY